MGGADQDLPKQRNVRRTLVRKSGINPKTYYYHLRKLREKVCEQIPVAVAVKAASGVTVRIGEATADIADGTSAETIAAVIHALKC